MKGLLLIAAAILFTSCAHTNWCPPKQASMNDQISTGQSAITKSKLVSSKITIKGIQSKLNELGHNSGPVDGIVGPITTRALQRFQTSNNLNTSGNITMKQLVH